MKDKLVKAYMTAWRWPEVYSSSPAAIWSSRALAFLLPIALIVVTIITGIPLFGWAATGLIAAFFGFVMILTTVKMFYHEYETVENFQSRETQVKEFFHGFPDLTDVPVIENEPGEWVAYGHVNPEVFLVAVQTVIRAVTEDEKLVEPYNGLQGSVGHLYARFTNADKDHWSEGLELCKPSTEDCFPITRLKS